jgi:hypothetical protein
MILKSPLYVTETTVEILHCVTLFCSSLSIQKYYPYYRGEVNPLQLRGFKSLSQDHKDGIMVVSNSTPGSLTQEPQFKITAL